MSAPRTPPPPPRSVPLSQALQASAPLAGLMERVQQSRQRLASVQDLLPATLRSSVRAGPLDDTTWVLLVDNAAAAAKLRQLLPALVGRLSESGWAGPEPKVKVQAPAAR
jgi:hypothetical protein